MDERTSILDLEARLAAAEAALRRQAEREASLRAREDRLAAEIAEIAELRASHAAAAEALRESEARYRAVFESIDEGVVTFDVVFDADGKAIDAIYVETNAALGRMTGLTNDIIGKRMRDVLPNLEPFWFDTFAQVLRTGEPSRFEYSVHDLRDQWFDVFATRVGGEGSSRIVLMYNTVTERKRAEAALQESEDRQAFLLKLTDALRPLSDPVEIQDIAARILGEHLDVDRTYYAVVQGDYEYAVVEREYMRGDAPTVIGTHAFATFGSAFDAFRNGCTMVVDDIEATDVIRSEDLAGLRALSIRSLINTPLVKGGRSVAGVTVLKMTPHKWTVQQVSLVEAVAERTWAAVERARAEDELRESELRFRTLADTAPAFIWFNDDLGANVFVNQAFLDYTGRSAEQVEGDRWHGLLHPDQEQAYVASYLDAVRTQTPWRGRNLLRRADGVWHWCDNYAKPLFRKDGSYRGHVGVLIDVDDKVRAEDALRESEERQAFLLKLSDALRPLVDARDIKAAAAVAVSEWLDISSAGYAEVEAGGLTSVITDEYNDGRIPSLTARYTLKDFSSVTEPMKRGETIYFANLDEDGVSPDTRAAFTAINVCAAVATPLIKHGEMVAYLFVAHPEPRGWTSSDLRVLGEVAERTWAAVERARAEAALQASEALRRVALEGGGMGTWRWSLEERCVWGDAKFMALWGFPASDEAQPLSLFTERMSPEGAHEMERIVTEAIAADEEFDGPLEIVAGPTAGRWIRWRGRPNKGAPSTLYGVTFDITEQREAERALRESEERFAQFANASAAALWIRDADTLNLEFTSQAIEKIYGIAPGAILGDEKRWAALVVPDDRDVALGHIEKATRGEAVVHEFRIRRPSDGAFRWIRDTNFPLYDAHGRVQRVGGIAEDVTEAKLAAEHQGVLLAELQHRVRNILALTRSIVARTGERARTVPEYAELILGRLLAFARVQALLTRAANVSVGIASIVRDEVSVQASHEGQYVLAGPNVELSPKAAEVLTLAVHELATNALKYGALSVPDGKVTVTWSTFEKRGATWLSFDWMEDGAPESPAADTEKARRRGFGSELIEGRVPYELKGRGAISIEAAGARCHLEFPLAGGASILETGAPRKATVFGGALDMTGEADLSGCRVLVVEDDYFLATDAVRALQGAGADTMGPCPTDADARLELQERRPDAVVLDVNLGSGADFKLAEHLKDNGIPFIFVTGYDKDVIPAEFENIERLEKPLQLRQIVSAVTKLLVPTG